MRNTSAPTRAAAPRHPGRARRTLGPAARKVAGGGGLILLALLFWYIFYQNLPDHPLNGAAPEGGTGPTNTLDRFVKICTIAISLIVMATQWSSVRLLARNINPGLVAFIALIPMSAMWSISPDDTLLRFVTLMSMILACLAIAVAGWDRRRLQQVAIPPVMVILVVSLVLGAMYPDKITEAGDDLSQKGAWHGITYTKNLFGMMASLGVIFCFNSWLARAPRRLWSVVGTTVAFICLLLSRSNTSLFATVLAMLFMVLVMRVPVIKQRFAPHVAIAFAAVLILTELLIQRVIPGISFILAPITGLTGKDASFSARTIIWDVIKDHIRGAPYLGSGYGAYWTGPFPTSPSYVFMYLMFFYPTESHNGYLEIMNDLGMLGLLCLGVFLIWYIRQAIQLMRFDRSQAALYLALLYQQMTMNMSESEWFSRSSTFAVLLLASTCLSRGLAECRMQARLAAAAGR